MQDYIKFLLSKNFISSCVIFIIVVVLFILLGKKRRKIGKKIEDLKDPKVIMTRRLIIAARILIVIIGFIIICQINGINLMSLVAGLGIIGAVVGLAFQDYLKDIIRGVHILSDRFFSIGDCVEINGQEGVVVTFSLTTTKIDLLFDHSLVTICNRDISMVKKQNGIFYIDLPLSYNEDGEKVHALLTESCKALSKMKDIKKCEFFGTQEFDSSSILYRIAVYCSGAKKPAVRRAALFELQKTLKEAGITIPFNQLDVHIDNGEE